jgi:hypothetical protein
VAYILCQRKRNLPRIDVRICEQRCPEREVCKEFRAYQTSREPAPQPQAAAAEEVR